MFARSATRATLQCWSIALLAVVAAAGCSAKSGGVGGASPKLGSELGDAAILTGAIHGRLEGSDQTRCLWLQVGDGSETQVRWPVGTVFPEVNPVRLVNAKGRVLATAGDEITGFGHAAEDPGQTACSYVSTTLFKMAGITQIMRLHEGRAG